MKGPEKYHERINKFMGKERKSEREIGGLLLSLMKKVRRWQTLKGGNRRKTKELMPPQY